MKSFLIILAILFFVNYNNSISQISLSPIFWLKADSGVSATNNLVSLWQDVRNNYSASQTNPANQATYSSTALNGRSGVVFKSGVFMNCSNIFPTNSDYTLCVVAKSLSSSNLNIVGGKSRTLWLAQANHAQVIHNGDFNNQIISSYELGVEPNLITVQYNNTKQMGYIWVNNVIVDSAFAPRNIDTTIYLGAYGNAGGNNFTGAIGEVILYNKFLSKSELNQTENFLLNKYSIKKPTLPQPPDKNVILFPNSRQFFSRDSEDSALVPVKGIVEDTSFKSCTLEILKDNKPYQSFSQELNFINGKAKYLFLQKIHSELSNYKFTLKISSAKRDSVIISKDSVVCGDFYLICGQSNSIFGGSNLSNQFCRTFGKNYSSKKADTLWVVANAVGSGGGTEIGAWGMKLALSIIEKHKIPVCVINGGVGGTTVEQNQRNDLNPLEPNNIYGSMNYRVEKSGLRKNIKALFWYQGESNSSSGYYNGMKAIYQDWKTDYPAIQKFYVIQTHHGCSNDASAVREVHRTLPDSLPNIEVISPHGLPFHDGCHYSALGYNQFGSQIFKLIDRDFYGSTDTTAISSPNIISAVYTDNSHLEIELTFSGQDNILFVQNDTLGNSMKDYFYFDLDSFKVKNIIANKNKISLQLKQPLNANTVTYTPDMYYNGKNIIYQGPYIKNQNGIGVLTFNKFPIREKGFQSVQENIRPFLYKIELTTN